MAGEHLEVLIEAVEGEVKWFDPRKGYGFIVGPEGQDIFTHYTAIDGDGFRVLRDGCLVKYSAERSDKGWKAIKVVRLTEDPDGKLGLVQRPNGLKSPRR